MLDEHETTLATPVCVRTRTGRQACVPRYWRHDLNADRRTHDEYQRAQGVPHIKRCVDKKGKIKKKCDTYLTPFEKFKTLKNSEQFLKKGVLLEDLEKVARSHSDTEYAKLMQQKKAQLFRSFAKPGILT